ncbi:hypothetical protein [Halocatena marina]|uniref:Uncharacterized protein n=1 Tax=Halocatena marina TaxID=2934937 RepID=A0ABD5YUR1_9EURY|nr:hypothetical protein [Halocatena marina]
MMSRKASPLTALLFDRHQRNRRLRSRIHHVRTVGRVRFLAVERLTNRGPVGERSVLIRYDLDAVVRDHVNLI